MKTLLFFLLFLFEACCQAQPPILRQPWTTNTYFGNVGIMRNGKLTAFNTVSNAQVAQLPGDIIIFNGTNTADNVLIFTNCTLMGYGSLLVNNVTNGASIGIPACIVPLNGTKIYGLTITNNWPAFFQAGIGNDERFGNPGTTNCYLEDVTILGDSDGLYFKGTTNGNSIEIVGGVFDTKWDNLVSDGFVYTKSMRCRYIVRNGSANASNTGMRGVIPSNGSSNDFIGCEFILVAGTSNGVSAFTPQASSNNVGKSKFFISVSTGTNNCGYKGTGGTTFLDGNVFDTDTDQTNITGVFGIINTSAKTALNNCVIFNGLTNFQAQINSGAGGTFRWSGGNITATRLGGGSISTRNNYNGGDVGTALQGAYHVASTNWSFFGTNLAPASTTTVGWLVWSNRADGKAYATPLANWP